MPFQIQGPGPGGIPFQPIPQAYSQPFQSLQFQTNEAPSTNVLREQASSPWGQTISPQWSWQSNTASSPSSQVSTPQQTPRWGALSPPTMPNPNRPQSVIHMQVPHALLPNINITRRGLRPLSRSQGSISSGELAPSPTVSVICVR